MLAAIQSGLDVQKFHAVGHSLGGQLCGYLARGVTSAFGGAVKLRRVTGLDPAGPQFFTAGQLQHLSADDADFVDIIHTDSDMYGQPNATGTADFWPNGGASTQPGCSSLPLVNGRCPQSSMVV